MTQDPSTWQEVALVAGPAIAAIAAIASWASVWQSRKLARESSTPHLQAQKIVNAADDTIGAVVTNAGGGAARGAGIYLSHPPFYVQGPIGHGFLFPGETRYVHTPIPVSDVETDVLVLCRDKSSVPHFWNASEEHRAYTDWRGRPKYQRDIPAVFREFHPGVDLNALTETEMAVTKDPQ
jgi:hypothetical protein